MYNYSSWSKSGCISLLVRRLPKLSAPFEKHWLGNLGNLGSNKEIQPKNLYYFLSIIIALPWINHNNSSNFPAGWFTLILSISYYNNHECVKSKYNVNPRIHTEISCQNFTPEDPDLWGPHEKWREIFTKQPVDKYKINKLTSVIFAYKAHHWALYHVWFQNKSELYEVKISTFIYRCASYGFSLLLRIKFVAALCHLLPQNIVDLHKSKNIIDKYASM